MTTTILSCRFPHEVEAALQHRGRLSQRPISQLAQAAVTYYRELNAPPVPEESTDSRLGLPRRIRLTPSNTDTVNTAARSYGCSPSHVLRHAIRIWLTHTTVSTLGAIAQEGEHSDATH